MTFYNSLKQRPLSKVCLVLLLILASAGNSDCMGGFDVKLSKVSNTYIRPENGNPPLFNGPSPVTRAAYSPSEKLIYTAGHNQLNVIDASDLKSFHVIKTTLEPTKDFSDLYVCGNRLFVAVSDIKDPTKGELRIYSLQKFGFQLQFSSEVGGNPSRIAIKEDCKTAVVALPGKPYTNAAGETTDPNGEIVIAAFPDETVTEFNGKITKIDFCSFNDKFESLLEFGVRFVSKDAGITFCQDVEPDTVVIDEDILGDTVYVTLQENNALAEIDLTSGTVSNIHGLGSKKWGKLDVSDADKEVKLSSWPIRSWFQPSGIQVHQWYGMTLLFTANQGTTRDFETTQDITSSELSDTVPDIVKAGIDDDTKLGNLRLSALEGRDLKTAKYKDLYTFGGRSFSVWGLSWGLLERLFDSKSQIEEITSKTCPHLFNRESEVDDRSTEMGSEPESIAVGEIEGRLYIFIGVKYPGLIFVFSLNPKSTQPHFETVFCDGIPNDKRTYKHLYKDESIYGLDPRDIRFIPAEQSPTGQPVLLVTGTASSTVTLLEVIVTKE